MIRPEVLAGAAAIREGFQRATPFRHVAIDGFLDVAAADALLADFPRFDPHKAVNEVGEVGRKAVIERVAGISRFYDAFFRYINSPAFLDAMAQLTGIPELIADATLFGGGTHENLDGQSLDVHVDFNIDERRMLHRRVNLLVYLNREWEDAWGGAIELHSNPWDPAADEVKSFLPLFNRAVIFETNEYSWHGFRRIALPEGKRHLSRKSFSIYLYTKDRPVDEVVAPHTTFYVPPPLPVHLAAGTRLTQRDVDQIHVAMANREGLVRMYQKLLVDKEQRLRNLMRVRQDALSEGMDVQAMLASRTWRLFLALQRAKQRLGRWLSRSGG